jgi:hypothetical protein
MIPAVSEGEPNQRAGDQPCLSKGARARGIIWPRLLVDFGGRFGNEEFDTVSLLSVGRAVRRKLRKH